MTEALVVRIRKMDDFRLIRFFQSFGEGIVNSLDLDRNTLIANIAPNATEDPALSSLLNLPPGQALTPLSQADAAEVARSTLEAMARHPGFEDVLCDALDGFVDDEMLAGIILAVGFAASMIIVAATTRFQFTYKDDTFEAEVIKDAASPELVKAVVVPLSKAATAVLSV